MRVLKSAIIKFLCCGKYKIIRLENYFWGNGETLILEMVLM